MKEHQSDHGKKAEKPQEHDELAALKNKADEYLNGWKRAQADYQNLEKKTAQEKLEIGTFAKATVLVQLVPILENLRRAFQHVPEEQRNAEWVVGLRHIQKQMEDLMRQYHLTEIEAEGKPFDPHQHEAVVQEKRDGAESGIVLEVLQSGWKIGDSVLIPSKVKVAE